MVEKRVVFFEERRQEIGEQITGMCWTVTVGFVFVFYSKISMLLIVPTLSSTDVRNNWSDFTKTSLIAPSIDFCCKFSSGVKYTFGILLQWEATGMFADTLH